VSVQVISHLHASELCCRHAAYALTVCYTMRWLAHQAGTSALLMLMWLRQSHSVTVLQQSHANSNAAAKLMNKKTDRPARNSLPIVTCPFGSFAVLE
jgi:predicted ATPase